MNRQLNECAPFMLYTLHQIKPAPIFIVRVYPPLHAAKKIYRIDRDLLKHTAHIKGRIFRIDDLTRLRIHQFTYADAYEWFSGDVREDARWRSSIDHLVVCQPGIQRSIAALRQDGHSICVSTFSTMYAAVRYSREELSRRSDA